MTDTLKKKRNIVAVFLCLVVFVVFAGYKNFWVRSLHQNMDLKGSSELSGEEYKKVKEGFVGILNRQDPKIALNDLRERVKTDNALLRSCHVLTHDLGHAAYQKYGDFGEAMKFQDEICNSGYLHGVIESYFSQNKPDTVVLQAVCSAYPKEKFMAWECYHGVGHGLMFFTQNDLPKSLALCEEYHSDFEKSSCVNGVFMENFNTNEKLHPSKFLRESNPFYPCGEQKEEDKATCYLYAPTYYLSMYKNDYVGVFGLCSGGTEFQFREACVQGVGVQAMKENINDVKLVEKICMNIPTGERAPCFTGMTGLYINHYGATEPAQKMCAQLEEENQQFCYNTIISRLALFSL
jgi:hypothetical protein